MKRLIKPVYAGINGKLNEDGKYKFEVYFDNNTNDDVVKFIEPYFYKSSIDDYTYWFGYKFNDGQSNPRRDEFIQFIKHVQPMNWSDPNDEWSEPDFNDESITEPELSKMLFNSLNHIGLKSRLIDTIIYPESKSGNLVGMIAKIIRQAIPGTPQVALTEVLKANPKNIQFDFESFHKDVDSGQLVVPEFVTDDYIEDMMNKVHDSQSFSLRKNVKPVSLRPYISGFYSHLNAENAIKNSDVILVVDDFGTSGTTVRELIRVIRSLNNDCEIFIFTLMGNNKLK